MAQHVKLALVKGHTLNEVPFRLLATPFPIQVGANVPGEAREDGPRDRQNGALSICLQACLDLTFAAS